MESTTSTMRQSSPRIRGSKGLRREVARQVRAWLSMQIIASPGMYDRARAVIAANVPDSTSARRLRHGRGTKQARPSRAPIPADEFAETMEFPTASILAEMHRPTEDDLREYREHMARVDRAEMLWGYE